ncbi:Ldh family oxidoreductase [Variovorax sp. J22R24]|uniref:Ldh family oxidoreductase n=1 Tax=Variovorax gracilis TaxID=3053502 RepID=UPI002574DF90|nr:Ldh family oxidoreductase [Variovorax sp. J22R24]MDM0108527.1 Ldh family oxidoreductase [Variovorax sp. J22R24]
MNLSPVSERFAAKALQRWATAVLMRQGVAEAPATLTAKVLVRTSLRGIDTHGLARLPAYVDKLATREVNAQARPRMERRHGLLHCDGDNGLGQVVASFALDEAMLAARTSALVACSIRSTGHLAALGGFVLSAAERGFFAILCQRTPPVMALPGARGPVIGNNPLAFAVPLVGRPPLVFDMAHSVVARGHVAQALREGKDAIPRDWAIGPDGTPTTDPALALQGAMQPIAGHKGLGLAMLVECLAGSLHGFVPGEDAAAPTDLRGPAANVSAFLLVINPALAVGQGAFDASVSAWMQTYLEASGLGARYPGQRQAECEQQRLRQGIPVPAGLLAELRALGRSVGRPFDLEAA